MQLEFAVIWLCLEPKSILMNFISLIIVACDLVFLFIFKTDSRQQSFITANDCTLTRMLFFFIRFVLNYMIINSLIIYFTRNIPRIQNNQIHTVRIIWMFDKFRYIFFPSQLDLRTIYSIDINLKTMCAHCLYIILSDVNQLAMRIILFMH